LVVGETAALEVLAQEHAPGRFSLAVLPYAVGTIVGLDRG